MAIQNADDHTESRKAQLGDVAAVHRSVRKPWAVGFATS
jgi:hypothetical protein